LPSTIEVLPEVVAAVGDRVEVMLDGGVRRGADVVKALALGARAVLVGRPYLYGLAVARSAGVGAVLEIFRNEIDNVIALLGCKSVTGIEPSMLRTRC
jgi:isopentenyl diphosphate isomerase/L-lactate dehydrogenase-like FMN-dependent dehydrogenase